MNDNKLIGRLKQLKKFEPSQKTLAILESRILRGQARAGFSLRGKLAETSQHLRVHSVLTVGTIAVCILLLVAIGEKKLVWQQAEVAFVRTEIALTSNTYEKARLSLQLSQSQLDILQRTDNRNLPPQIAYVSDSTSQTDRYIHSLSLKGEPGKYTMQQCLAAYRTYSDYLDKLKSTTQDRLAVTNNKVEQLKLRSLLDQTVSYEQQADAKLKQY